MMSFPTRMLVVLLVTALGYDHERAIGVELADLLAETQPVGSLGGGLDDHQVDQRRLQDGERCLGVGGGVHSMAVVLQQRAQHFLLERIPVDR